MQQDSQYSRRVIFVARTLTHYRVPFHERVRMLLRQCGIDYELVHCAGRDDEEAKSDLVDLPWARKLDVTYFGPGQRLCWQHDLSRLGKADLIILGQENALLANYLLIVSSWFTRQRLGFFGHGRNFQARSKTSPSERFKRFWTGKVHWWFAYTPSGRDAVVAAGFPASKVTVFNNGMDISAIRQALGRIDPAWVSRLRREIAADSGNVGVYVGGLYPEKRVPFLLEAARHIRERVPDFHLVVIGAGVDSHLVARAAAEHSWIHHAGPKFGDEKTALMSLAKVVLMPGLVGLAVLDSFAHGTPMVTTDLPFHSPEIDYLEDGVNGVIVRDSDNPRAYADAVVKLLADEAYRAGLGREGQKSAALYTIETMAERFVDGVAAALSS